MTPQQLKQLITTWNEQKAIRLQQKQKAINPGIRLRSTAGRLAHSWFDFAAANGDSGIKAADSDLQKMKKLFQGQEKAEIIFQNREFQRKELHKVAETTLGFSPGTVKFLDHLVQQRHMRALKDVMHNFEVLVKSYRKEVDAILTVAKPLSQKDLEKYTSDIRTRYLTLKPEEKLNLRVKVDPSIRGGFELYSKGTYVDMGINRRLMAMLHSMRDEEIANYMNPDSAASRNSDNNSSIVNNISATIRRLSGTR